MWIKKSETEERVQKRKVGYKPFRTHDFLIAGYLNANYLDQYLEYHVSTTI
jgi:hypothetical protein